jgi:hypothetical protein
MFFRGVPTRIIRIIRTVLIVAIPLFFIYIATSNLRVVTNTGTISVHKEKDLLRQQREDNTNANVSTNVKADHIALLKTTLTKKYNLTHTRKSEAVNDALNFVIQQNELSASSIFRENTSTYTDMYKQKCSPLSCPYCDISWKSVLSRGILHYQDTLAPPYDFKCWSARIRYHAAPACVVEESSRLVKPIYKWQWGLQESVDGYCQLPKLVPQEVAASYIRANSGRSYNRSNNVVTVLMLGLSFMGQPFQSLGCLFEEYLTSGEAYEIYWESGDRSTSFKLEDIRKGNGQCTGYASKEIKKFFPADLHGNMSKDDLPKQNFDKCHLDHATMRFEARSSNEATMVVCYHYVFNSKQNVRPGSSLPCKLQWTDVDIVLSIVDPDEMFSYYVPNTMSPDLKTSRESLKHVKFLFINRIYQGYLHNLLVNASAVFGGANVDAEDYNAKFKSCTKNEADIHYRLPGIPDLSVKIWFYLIYSGLSVGDTYEHTSSKWGCTYWA